MHFPVPDRKTEENQFPAPSDAIQLPTEFGPLYLKWDESKFTGIVPVSATEGILHYDGKEFKVLNPADCTRIIQSHMAIERVIAERIRQIQAFEVVGVIGISSNFEFWYRKYRTLFTLHWIFSMPNRDVSKWVLDVRVCMTTFMAKEDDDFPNCYEDSLDLPTLNLTGVDVTALTKREIEYGVYDMFMSYIQGFPTMGTFDLEGMWLSGRLNTETRLGNWVLEVKNSLGEVLLDIRLAHSRNYSTSPRFAIKGSLFERKAILTQAQLDRELRYFAEHDSRSHQVAIETYRANAARQVAEIKAAAMVQCAKIRAEGDIEAGGQIAGAIAGQGRTLSQAIAGHGRNIGSAIRQHGDKLSGAIESHGDKVSRASRGTPRKTSA